ncbi:hypothetical protein HBI24_242860 [Parastagonospora nodorum]|nr:hypothetical protein HBH50_228690 [Parastagonospora nodorum]KAH4078803.1 hypothetical protein HBH48_227570 [Parastagonospora nodorum]KAH4155964.1 hypothetical protein HBH43_210700 [Parastagonospora nodorum]KAH4286995.1 hypothetical protein HBI02_218600 [Parastagonospora nodorum]KAH4288366.1 hypothetical protein HBI01_222620 [Parastagonospora nodorum]
MSLYQYQALEHWDSFRLVILHPASRSTAPIRCSLQHVRSTELPKYEAISYTWGNTNLLHSLHMGGNGNFLKVTTNCFHALRHLRRADSDRALWIDAICINQMDLNERGHQLKTMNMIYEMASTVVIHLGEETRGSRILFKELAKAEAEFSETGQCNRKPPSNTIIGELEALIQRPWFRRIWVLQEVSGNPSLAVMCGSARISMGALEACLYGYRNFRVIEDVVPLPIRLWSRQRLEVEGSIATIHLWHQLVLSRTYLATDPRDKVFALRSLLPKELRSSMDYLIDYTASTEQIFIKTAMCLLPRIGLHLLITGRHPHSLSMPSWIPDFSQTSPLDSWTPYKSIGEVPSSFTVSDEVCVSGTGLALHVDGVRYATIRKTSRVWSFRDMQDVKDQMHAFYNSLPVLSQLIYGTWDEQTEYGSYQCDTEILQMLILQARYDVRALGFDLQRGYGGGDYEHDTVSALIFPREFHEGLAESRIVLTDTFDLAIVPAAACIGDTICMFQHGQSPSLLRQQDERRWKMISGDCYVFGRMGRERDAEFPYRRYCARGAADMETFEIC